MRTARVLVANPAPEGAKMFPASISVPDYAEALRPLFALWDISPDDVVAEGLSLTGSEIQFLSTVPVRGVSPVAVGEGLGQMWAWPVTIQVRR